MGCSTREISMLADDPTTVAGAVESLPTEDHLVYISACRKSRFTHEGPHMRTVQEHRQYESGRPIGAPLRIPPRHAQVEPWTLNNRPDFVDVVS